MVNHLNTDVISSIKSKETEYAESFRKFVNLGDEKVFLLKKIRQLVHLRQGKRFLDIGGGFGHFTIPLSKEVGSTLVVEPNRLFSKKFRANGIQCEEKKWEEIELSPSSFDIILAAFVATHFPKSRLPSLLRKMIRVLAPNGELVLMTIDGLEGTWREIHTIFYRAIGLGRRVSSSLVIKKILKKIGAREEKIVIYLSARTKKEIIDALAFDFVDFQKEFDEMRPLFEKYLIDKRKGKLYQLSMVINFYYYQKPNSDKNFGKTQNK